MISQVALDALSIELATKYKSLLDLKIFDGTNRNEYSHKINSNITLREVFYNKYHLESSSLDNTMWIKWLTELYKRFQQITLKELDTRTFNFCICILAIGRFLAKEIKPDKLPRDNWAIKLIVSADFGATTLTKQTFIFSIKIWDDSQSHLASLGIKIEPDNLNVGWQQSQIAIADTTISADYDMFAGKICDLVHLIEIWLLYQK